ncbi:SDR family oxidoreductase [Microlunatus soli]|uniref:NAD(P)-dependent dehydrogenase, short-chain alcohol dehydrogenase family n=1 Tax=Microlunatus soli TaxID=630515 RepID=A0A1H1XKL7_9ACTN|nr:SDR family oxidoreductase [Microlunatus soli]SDT09797.1 NAD(P)-dependent dehydrogenase, short-chain alcohol dehydrogenase family [Microlunatus soli]
MATDFSDQVIAVTGAAGGIGQAICRRLADDGATVYALDTHAGVHGIPVEIDVTSAESLGAARDRVLAEAGKVDGVVAAAGIVEDDVAAEQMSAGQFRAVIEVNLVGVFLTCQAFGQPMLRAGSGSVVAISSMSGNHVVNTPQDQCAYNASKAGVSALVRSLAAEWGPRGVRVNAIAPGYVDTPLLAAKKHQFAQWLQATPAGRMARPEEVAATAAFLLGDESAFYCGSELLMDGGYSLR